MFGQSFGCFRCATVEISRKPPPPERVTAKGEHTWGKSFISSGMRLAKAERAAANFYGSRAEILKAGDVGSEFLREQVDGGKGGGSDDLFKNGIVNLTAQRAGYRKLGEVKYQFDVKNLDCFA